MLACGGEMAGGYEAISAVVPFADEDGDALRCWELLQGEGGGGGAGVFHEGLEGDSKLGDGALVAGAHLGGG